MNLNDSRGVPVSTDNRAALARYGQAVELFHGYFGNPLGLIEEAIAEVPDMGHCFRAGLLLSEPTVRESVAAAERLAPQIARTRQAGTNARMTKEVGLPVCRALLAFGHGDYPRTVELLAPVRRMRICSEAVTRSATCSRSRCSKRRCVPSWVTWQAR